MSNMSSILLGRFPGLESDVPAAGGVADALEVGQVVDEDGAQLDGENLVENDLIEAEEESDVVDEGNDEADELVETAEALESYLAVARSAGKQGGWTTQEAAAHELGLNIVMGRIGANASFVMPSLESFGSSRERINATTSVENRITETLKKIWEAIKRAVNKVIAFVRKWYLKIADGASRLKKRAEAIRSKAENTNGSAKEKKIRIPLSSLHINKNAPKAAQLVSGMKTVTTVIDDLTKGPMSKGYEKVMTAMAVALEKSASTGNLSDKRHEKITASETKYAQLSGEFSEDNKAMAKFAGANENANKGYSVASVLPGGKRFFALDLVLADDAGSKELAAGSRSACKVIVADATDSKVELDNSKEVDVLSPQDVVAISNGVIDLAQAVIDYRAGFENYDKQTKDTLKRVDKVANSNTKGDNDAENEAIADIRAVATATGNMIRNHGTSITAVINYGLNLGRNALVYGNSSLNQYA